MPHGHREHGRPFQPLVRTYRTWGCIPAPVGTPRDPKIAVGVFGFESILLTQGNVLDSFYSGSNFANRKGGGLIIESWGEPRPAITPLRVQTTTSSCATRPSLKLRRHALSTSCDYSVNIFATTNIFGRCPVTMRQQVVTVHKPNHADVTDKGG